MFYIYICTVILIFLVIYPLYNTSLKIVIIGDRNMYEVYVENVINSEYF